VIYRCKGDLRPDLMTEIIEHSTIKILGIFNGDLLRNSIMTDDVLPEKILDGGGGIFVTGFASTHLVKYSTVTMAKM
jgi:hypothetical protein